MAKITKHEFDEKLTMSLADNAIFLNSTAKDKLWQYYLLSQDWGQKQNLTTNLDLSNYIRENILDPASALKTWQSLGINTTSLIDLGAGGGYVGLTVTILDGNINSCILLESVRKKVSFMRHCVRELGLTRAIAVQDRAETWNPATICDLVVSRATWSWDNFLKITKRYLQQGSTTISFEGAGAHRANTNLPPCVAEYELKPHGIKRYLYICTATASKVGS